MRLTQILNSPPIFRYWTHFGAGKQRRMPYYKQWWYIWKCKVMPKKPVDYTLPLAKLPPGSRIMEASDFLEGPIDLMPDEIMQKKSENIVINHPWPFNVVLDSSLSQEPMYCYRMDNRFFLPKEDCQALTNTLLETERMAANPPFELTEKSVETIRRQYEWATEGDSVLKRLPRKRAFIRLDQKPLSKYGIIRERKEYNVLSAFQDYSQNLLAEHYHNIQDQVRLNDLLSRRSLSFPKCTVPFDRQNHRVNFDLCIDLMSVNSKPLSGINQNPENTRERQIVDIKPRGWRSLLEASRNYDSDWSFTLPTNTHPHTIQLASRGVRDHFLQGEMLARMMIHTFGLASQFARFREITSAIQPKQQVSGEATDNNDASTTSHEQVDSEIDRHMYGNKLQRQKVCSLIMEDPLSVAIVNERELLENPVVVQAIGFDANKEEFYFLRYQLNSLKFDDNNESRIKNQAWYSGPIHDLKEVLSYYVDFESFGCAQSVSKMSEREAFYEENIEKILDTQTEYKMPYGTPWELRTNPGPYKPKWKNNVN